MQKPLDLKCPHCGTAYQVVQVQTDTYTDAEIDCLMCGQPLQTGDGDSFFKYFLVDPSWSAASNYWRFITIRSITMTCASCRAGGNSVGRAFRLPIRSSGAAHRGVCGGSIAARQHRSPVTQHHDPIRIQCRALLVF